MGKVLVLGRPRADLRVDRSGILSDCARPRRLRVLAAKNRAGPLHPAPTAAPRGKGAAFQSVIARTELTHDQRNFQRSSTPRSATMSKPAKKVDQGPGVVFPPGPKVSRDIRVISKPPLTLHETPQGDRSTTEACRELYSHAVASQDAALSKEVNFAFNPRPSCV